MSIMNSQRLPLRIVTLAAAFVTVLALATPASAAPVTVNVGAALTLSGTNQAFGNSSRRGIDLAVKEINASARAGIKVKVKTIDDFGTPEGAAAAYGIFFRDGVSAIMGPTLSSVALTVNHFAQGARIPVLGISNTLPGITEIGTFIFRPALTEQFVLPRVVKAVAESPIAPKTVVLIVGSDAMVSATSYSATTALIFRQALAENGVVVVKEIAVPVGMTDFASIGAEVKAADPDIVAITALPAEGIPLLTAIRNAKFRKNIIGSNAFNTQEIITGAQAAANGLIVGTAWSSSTVSKRNQAFIKAFKKEYKRIPDQFAATGYAYTYVLAAAVKRGNSATQASIQTQLAAITGPKSVATLLGKFRFDLNRNGISPVRVQEVVSQKFAIFPQD